MHFIMTALTSQYYHAVYFDSGSSGFLNFQFMTLFEKASKDHYALVRGQITRSMSAQGTTDNSIFQQIHNRIVRVHNQIVCTHGILYYSTSERLAPLRPLQQRNPIRAGPHSELLIRSTSLNP